MKLAKDFPCAPEGHTVIVFKAGDVVTGRVAEWALAAGYVEIEAPEPKPLETQAMAVARPRGRPRK